MWIELFFNVTCTIFMKRYSASTSVQMEGPDISTCKTLVKSEVESHEIKVVISVDNRYKLTVDGKTIPVDPNYNLWTINTHKFTVTGNGPWVVAVEGTDEGVVAGFIGTVYVDNILKAETGTLVSPVKFKTFLKPSDRWDRSISFDDSRWFRPAACSSRLWDGWVENFKAETKSNAGPIWHLSCRNTDITAKFRAIVSA